MSRRIAIYFEETQVKHVAELLIFDIITTEYGDRIVAGIDTRFDPQSKSYVVELSLCPFTDLNTRTRFELPYEGGIGVHGRFIDPTSPDVVVAAGVRG